MRFLQVFKRSYRALVPSVPTKKEMDVWDEEIETDIVSGLSRGEVGLQEGVYLSDSTLEIWSKEVANHHF